MLVTPDTKTLAYFEGVYLAEREKRALRPEAFAEALRVTRAVFGDTEADKVYALWFDPNRTDPITNDELWFLA